MVALRVALISRDLPPRGGGIGVYTEKTASALAAAGHEPHVFTSARTETSAVRLVDGVHIHSLSNSWSRLREVRVIVGAIRVDRAIRRVGPFDIVQACEWEAEAALYARRGPAPLITRLATPHYLNAELNGVPMWERKRQFLVRQLERYQTTHSALVLSPSSALADRVSDDWGLQRDRIAMVPTGIRQPLWCGGDSFTAAQLPKPYVLYFGRLELRKGVQEWIEALPLVLSRHPNLTAVFAGRDVGSRGRSFRDYSRQVCGPLWPRLRFLPHLDQQELFPIVAGAALVVLPSRWESLSNACLEAMALGRPVLATRGSAFEELIEDGVSGFLVAPRAPAALADVASRVVADPPFLAQVGEAAGRRARQYELTATVARLIEVYAQL